MENQQQDNPNTSVAPRNAQGLYGLSSSIIVAAINTCVPDFVLSRSSTATNMTYYEVYTVIIILLLISMLLFSIPAIKKSKRLDIAGLVGLIISLIVIYEAVATTLALISVGTTT